VSAETSDMKAHRLLTEGRLIVRTVGDPSHPGRIVAECRGDSGMIYLLGYDPKAEEWRCQCAEMKGNCSHLKALKLVVVLS
jgi:hypothetical protein